MSERTSFVPSDVRSEAELQLRNAKKYSIENPDHRLETVSLLLEGSPAVVAFNGIYGIFGDAYNIDTSDTIKKMKERDPNKGLVIVSLPEALNEVADLTQFQYDQEQIIGLQTELHALGLILPAAQKAPEHLKVKGEADTILSIWTEYKPFRDLLEEFRREGGIAFAGTSANKAGDITHIHEHEVQDDFKDHVPVVLGANFDGLDESRRMSTSVVKFDLNGTPILHRWGNTSPDEINESLVRNGFPKLYRTGDETRTKSRISQIKE